MHRRNTRSEKMGPRRMSRAKDSRRRTRSETPQPEVNASDVDPFHGWRWLWAIALAVILFYWIPLTNADTSPQWDAIDVHYSSQKYFSEHIRAGELPFWTPHLFSGFPFLADPQVGAWYPPNWPFFLVGITPKSIQAELALHALIATVGAYLLFFSMTGARVGSLIGALFYGLSGFFADHSQHVGMFSAAAWAPWLLWCCRRALATDTVRWTAIGGLIGGCMVLAGHFQTALYAFCGLGLYGLVELARKRATWMRTLLVIAGMAALALAVSAVQTLPGLELAGYSERATVDYGSSTERVLELGSLVNLVWPNATGVFSTDGQRAFGYYLYSGLLLLPLAGLGLLDSRVRKFGAVLVGVSVWYMLGPDFGLYKLGALVPGLHSVRAPVHGWFLVTLGLALLAASGAEFVISRFGQRPIYKLMLVAVVFADLFFWNSLTNPVAYARYSFDELYGGAENRTQRNVAALQPELTRYHAPRQFTLFGPLNHPLDIGLEATYGYNPLELMHYKHYFDAAANNPKLLAGLNVSRRLDPELRRAAIPFAPSLPRAYFAKTLVTAANERESRELLAELDPAFTTLVAEPLGAALGGSTGDVRIVSATEQEYVVEYASERPALLRMSVPYFPGWTATAGDEDLRIVRVDHAFMGVIVPAGQRQVRLVFSSTYFRAGAVISLIATLLMIAVAIRKPQLPLASKPRIESGPTAGQRTLVGER